MENKQIIIFCPDGTAPTSQICGVVDERGTLHCEMKGHNMDLLAILSAFMCRLIEGGMPLVLLETAIAAAKEMAGGKVNEDS